MIVRNFTITFNDVTMTKQIVGMYFKECHVFLWPERGIWAHIWRTIDVAMIGWAKSQSCFHLGYLPLGSEPTISVHLTERCPNWWCPNSTLILLIWWGVSQFFKRKCSKIESDDCHLSSGCYSRTYFASGTYYLLQNKGYCDYNSASGG